VEHRRSRYGRKERRSREKGGGRGLSEKYKERYIILPGFKAKQNTAKYILNYICISLLPFIFSLFF